MARLIPVGIYNNELFIAEEEWNEKAQNFEPHRGIDNMIILSVIRPVMVPQLENYHDPDYMADYLKDIWIETVRHGNYTESLETFVKQCMNEEDDGDERYVGKDESDCDVFDYDEALRDLCDKFIQYREEEEVGTWESAGSYLPDGHFELILDKEIAQEIHQYIDNKKQ